MVIFEIPVRDTCVGINCDKIYDEELSLSNTPFWAFLTCIYLLFFTFFIMWYYPLYHEEKHQTGDKNE